MMSLRGEPRSRDSQNNVFNTIIQDVTDEHFHEMTGKKGDVILLHPLTLHSVSKNGRRLPSAYMRPYLHPPSPLLTVFNLGIISNPPVSVAAPFQFNRSDPAEYSLVELKTIQDVGGLEKFRDWKITGERERFAPGRLALKEKLYEQEVERLRALGIKVGEKPLSQMPALILSGH